MTIVEFIEQRIAEDERVARAAGGREWHAIDLAEEGISILDGEDDGDPEAGFSYHPPRNEQTRQITANSPAATLRRCVGLRLAVTAILADISNMDGEFGDGCGTEEIRAAACKYPESHPDRSPGLRGIASFWSNHPDYQQEWATA